jgi:hypothetical protein
MGDNVCATGAEQCLHLVKPQQDLDRLAKGNWEFASPTELAKPYMYVCMYIFKFCNQLKEMFDSLVEF